MGATLSHIVRSWASALVRHLGSSDYLAGMLAMSVIAFGRDAAHSAWQSMFAWLIRRLWITIRLEEKEAELLRAWLRERPEVHGSGELAVYSRRGEEAGSRIYEFEPELETTCRLRVTGKNGRSQWIWVTQGAKQSATVSFLGRSKKVLDYVFEQGHAIQKRKLEKELVVVQVYDFGGETGLHWLHPQERVAKQPGRPVSSVVLPRCPTSGLDQGEALLRDAREFLASEGWYSKRGIPYRRGYLLHGVPGGGKSSIVMALAHELQLPIYMLSLSSEKMSDDKLNQLLQFGMYDPPTILLLEDVDLLHSAVLHRTKQGGDKSDEDASSDKKDGDDEKSEKRQKKGQLTLSGLLNALDGPTATTGRLLFMTTNARERLDPALIRSGRIDYEIEFKPAEQEQIQRLFSHFYSDYCQDDDLQGTPEPKLEIIKDSALSMCSLCGGSSSATKAELGITSAAVQGAAEEFAKQLSASGTSLTTADIQRHLVKHKANPQHALGELPALIRGRDGSPSDADMLVDTERTQDAGVQVDPSCVMDENESLKTGGSSTPISAGSRASRPEICPEGIGFAGANTRATVESAEVEESCDDIKSKLELVRSQQNSEEQEDEETGVEKLARPGIESGLPACDFWEIV